MISQVLMTVLGNPLGIATVAAPFVMDHINAGRAKLAAEASHRNSELTQANQIATAVSGTTDNLAYLSKQVMFGIVFRKLSAPEDQATWKMYQEALIKWESSKSTVLAQVEMYFGADCAATLGKIREDFDTLENQINAAYYKRTTSKWYIEDKEGSKNDFRKKYLPVWDRLVAEMTELNKEMIRQIQYVEVGSLREKTDLVRS
ncbi:MAG TPA: hypothetical protein VJ866_21810 [Pyrinomonadaceae bacterium]|nr:hypothetical protein [Pyrinomonadaceae bacterium]